MKYRTDMPVKPFENLTQARRWVEALVRWYNCEHRHSAIGFVAPAQRHAGQDIELLQQHTKIYTQARQKNPHRWSKNVRNWSHIEEVYFNPDKPKNKEIGQPKKQAEFYLFGDNLLDFYRTRRPRAGSMH